MRRRIERHLADAVGPLFAFLARLVPTRRSSIVVRSQAVSDDQAAQTIAFSSIVSANDGAAVVVKIKENPRASFHRFIICLSVRRASAQSAVF